MSEFKDANIEKYSDGAEIDGYISNNYHDKRLQIALKLVDKYCSGKNLHSLDIGAGNNYFSTKLAEKGFHPTVIDLYEMQKIQVSIMSLEMLKKGFRLRMNILN